MQWYCVVLCCVVGSLAAQDVGEAFPDYWSDDDYYDSFDKVVGGDSKEVISGDPNKLDTEFKLQDQVNTENSLVDDTIVNDHQIEDNRSSDKSDGSNDGDVIAQNNLVPDTDEEPMADDGDIGELPFEEEEPQFDNFFEEFNDVEAQNHDDASEEKKDEPEIEKLPFDDDYVWDDVIDDKNVNSADNDERIFEETKNILDEDSGNGFDDQPEQEPVTEESVRSNEEIEHNNEKQVQDNEEIDQSDEEDTDELFDQIKNKPDVEFTETKANEDGSNENVQEDTADKVYADLNSDLDKLYETIQKLKEDGNEENKENEEEVNIEDYEDKFNRPYREGAVLSARDEYYSEIEDSNLSDIFNGNAENDDISAEDFDSDENIAGSEEVQENVDTSIQNKKEETNETDSNEEGNKIENVRADMKDRAWEYMDETFEDDSNPGDEAVDGLKQIFGIELSPYGNDGLVAEGQPKDADAEEIQPFDSTSDEIDDVDEAQQAVTEKNVEITTERIRTKMVDELSSAEFNDIMSQFAIVHQEDFDVNSQDFDKHVAPIHITISVNEPTVVTSPNYPDPYPTNNVIDWIFEGEGRGIELNITDFAVNGNVGDYLLIKPGGIDESGRDGLIFSYRLHSERRYRFTDVNRMFVRFEAKLGMSFLRGFQFSVRSILPPLERVEQIPEPEPVVEPPRYTLTLNLAGLTVSQFQTIQESFKVLIADMANRYINENDIYYGINSTLEVTQITRTAVCSVHLPNYETCVQVTFGVPLNYGDEQLEPRLNVEDLEDMWNSLAQDEMFAERLSQMGIEEYVLPNDRAVVTVWLVIAAGVVISMAMLGFALWRFSCFEDYTRMRAFNDNDSVNEKRNLDLYPTPHQTLPPLYAESEYKWADDKYNDSTRVDMGGFANKSYMRDELFDFESDEDVITPRDRKGDISSRDIYAV